MPAYDYNTWFALFFVTYEIVNLYIFMNVVLATIYNNYKEHLKVVSRGSVCHSIAGRRSRYSFEYTKFLAT